MRFIVRETCKSFLRMKICNCIPTDHGDIKSTLVLSIVT